MYDRGGHWVTKTSSRGHSYQVWKFAVPRIDDIFLECVVYLYPDRPSAEAGKQAGGSGFLVGVPVEGFEHLDLWVPFAVSNRHVIKNGSAVVRVTTIDGGAEIMELDERSWLFHPDHDLAIAPIDLTVERHRVRLVFWPKAFLTEQIVAQYRIGLGDECFMVSRFIAHDGHQRNTPSLRFGAIAQMPTEKIRFDDGSEQESFLVEARSVAGHSGSPVFVWIPPFSGQAAGRISGSWISGPWLLGVDHCHLFSQEKVYSRATRQPVNDDWNVRGNTGMMGVVPAWRLGEMFSFPDVASLMAREKEKWIKEHPESDAGAQKDE
jgi:hypothetical protein